jgi:D-3-phosphoglycerate dehydrogenase
LLDFDSTLVRVETLDVLAEFALEGDPEAEAKRAEIVRLTDAAMAGELAIDAALDRRLSLLNARQEAVDRTAARLLDEITPSVARRRAWLHERADRIWIVSSGFEQLIAPVAAELGLAPERVLANRLVFRNGRATAVDASRPLARPRGKVEAVRSLEAPRPILMVGDGWTDYEVRAGGEAQVFAAFIEVVARPRVTAVADLVATSFDVIAEHVR